ncbi:MAG: CHASE2 domain-containing protein [Thermodesulfovibrionales bacterium]|nr:CHASE2 domain-containing protein [Thermodesulfovibrionales bacterium]
MKLRRILISLLIGIIAASATLALYRGKIEFLSGIDLKLKDARLKLREEVKPDERVVIAAIDSKSVNELGRWPWDREVMAGLINGLNVYGAKTIALDMIFAEPSNSRSDMALSDAMRQSGNVIAGYYFRHEEESQVSWPELIEPSKIKILKMHDGVEEVPIVAYPEVETNIPPISMAADSSGYFNIIPDKDGLIRAANLLLLYNGEVYPSLPLQALRHYLGNEVVLEIAVYGVDKLLIGSRKIPADESGRLTLNYYGRQGAFRTVPAVDVIKGRLKPGSLKDAIVFIGPTEVGIADVRATPVDPVLPGVEIHATVASSVLKQRFLLRDGRVIGLEMFFIIFFPLMLTLILSFIRRTVSALLFFLLTIGLYSYIDYVLFSDYLLNTSMLFPFISITISYLGAEAYRNLVEEQKSRFMKKAFTSYVSPDLVGEIIKNPDRLKLGGERREITVLFSDIRGFTTMSEKLSPENLVLLLNQYLGPMTNLVLKHKGTLDKYIGDAIMALYNAPLTIENHSALACETALGMMEKLKELNAAFKEKGFMEIDIGVGINTGDAIVGNMGTDVRFDYTAIGDTVNLASRLEGMCKVYKAHIVVSEFAVRHIEGMGAEANPKLKFRELDVIKVKGKDKPVTIYELPITENEALIKRFHEARGLYRAMEFKEAGGIFKSLYESYKDKTSLVYAERCAEFIENPPVPDGTRWDGVYEAKTK